MKSNPKNEKKKLKNLLIDVKIVQASNNNYLIIS